MQRWMSCWQESGRKRSWAGRDAEAANRAAAGASEGAELSNHLSYEKHASAGWGSRHSRNGTSRKAAQDNFGAVEIEMARDRKRSFEPKILPKDQQRFVVSTHKILLMYARRMSTREIQGHLEDLRRRSESIADQRSDRYGDSRSTNAAEPAAGSDLHGGVPGCADRKKCGTKEGENRAVFLASA